MASPEPSTPARRGYRRWKAVLAGFVVLSALLIGLAGLAAVAVIGGSGPPVSGAATGTIARSQDGYSVWQRNHDGSPVRWDACSPIELVVAPASAPPGARADLDVAVGTLREATGLDIEVTGETTERPSASRSPYQPERFGERWAPVLIAWASPSDGDSLLRETDRGIAIPVAVGPEGDRAYVSGQVVFNADRRDLRPGRADRADAWGATILHELAHVLGLGHVDEPGELMYVHPGEGPVRLGDGDLAGLTAVGAEGGCIDVPDAGPVAVTPP